MESPLTHRIWFYSQNISLGVWIFGYNLGVLNPSYHDVSVALHWGSNENLYLSIFQTILPVGCVIGSLSTSYIANNYGRRICAFTISITTILGSFISIFPYNASFAIGRLLSGVASGMGLSLAPFYIVEICPTKLKATVGSLIHLNLALGLGMSYCLGIAIPVSKTNTVMDHWWQFMYFFPTFIAIYILYIFKRVHKLDTPKFYTLQQDFDKATAALEYTFGEASNPSLLEKINVQNEKETLTPYKELLCTKKFRLMLSVSIILPMLEQFCGINAATFYSTKILYDVSGDIFISRVLTASIGISKFFATFLILILVKHFGRKTIIIYSLLAMGVLCVAFALLSSVINLGIYPSTIVLGLHVVVYTSSFAAILWVFIGESVDQRLVPIGVCSKFSFLCLVTFLFPLCVEALGIETVFYFFAFCSVVGFIWCKLSLIETKGLTRGDIRDAYTKSD